MTPCPKCRTDHGSHPAGNMEALLVCVAGQDQQLSWRAAAWLAGVEPAAEHHERDRLERMAAEVTATGYVHYQVGTDYYRVKPDAPYGQQVEFWDGEAWHRSVLPTQAHFIADAYGNGPVMQVPAAEHQPDRGDDRG